MISIRSLVTGEVQHVEQHCEERYPADVWELLPAMPEALDRSYAVFVDGEWGEELGALEEALHGGIDEAAGRCRCRIITDVPGQQLTYARKEAEARAWIAGGASLSALPFLAAEVAATGLITDEAAAAVVEAADAWATIGSAIEGARIAAKRAVSAAETASGKIAAAQVDWQAVVLAAGGEW